MHVVIPAVSRFTQMTGICRHAVNHAKALTDLPDISQVTLLVGPWQRHYFNEAILSRVRRIAVATGDCTNNSISRNLWYSRKLPELALNLNADLVHVAYPVPIKRDRFLVPIITTVHDTYPFDRPENFGFPRVLFNQNFLRRCVSESDALVCVSGYTRERLLHYFPKLRTTKIIATIYSYSDLPLSLPVRPVGFYRRPFILTVGQHRSNKNHDVVIRAYALLLRSESIASDLPLVIAGATGPATKSLKSLVYELSIAKNVIFLDNLTDSNLSWLYRNCELFVAASSIEGFGLPLLEAYELSPRVVCSDIPTFREVAGDDCTFILDPVSVDSLAQAIRNAMNSSRHRAAAGNSRFTRVAATNGYARLYSQLLDIAMTNFVSLSDAS